MDLFTIKRPLINRSFNRSSASTSNSGRKFSDQRFSFKILLIVLLSISFSASIRAKESAIEEHLTDADLVIVGDRADIAIDEVAADIQVITEEEIRRSGVSTLVEILQGLSSIQIGDNSTNATFSLRGFSAQQAGSNTLILLNGRRLNNSDLAAPQLANINVNNIVRIEILNSSAGVLYGDQAVGGVINIITIQKENSATDLYVSAGSYQAQQAAINSSIKLDENWQLQLALNHVTNNHFREHNEESQSQKQITLDYETEQQGFTLTAEQNDQKINTPGALLLTDLQLDRSQSRSEFSQDFIKLDNSSYRLASFFKLSNNWKLIAELQQSNDDSFSRTSFLNFAVDSTSNTNRKLLSFTPRLVKKFNTDSGWGSVTTGIDMTQSKYAFSFLGRSNKQTLSSGYIYSTVPLSTDFTLNTGVRYANVKDKLIDAFVYSNGIDISNNASAINLGGIYDINSKLKFYARFENNFRFAKVDEQAYTSPGVVGLNPQQGNSFDLGFKYGSGDSRLKISAYRLKLKDEIIFDPSQPPPTGAFFQGANVNADKSTRDGIKFTVEQLVSQKFSVNFNANWINARFTSGFNKGNTIPGVSKKTAHINLKYFASDNQQLTLEYLFTGKRKQEGDNSNFFPEVKSYGLFNLSYYLKFNDRLFDGKLNSWEFSARINNLLDKKYNGFALFNGFYPAAERNFTASLRYYFVH